MKSISKLKNQARLHEQKEEWSQAIRAYEEVIRIAEEGAGDIELGLLNRIGDLHLRLGHQAEAVRCYERAADHYADAGLYNNAIALCNKALRHVPQREDLYRKLGQLSAAQGFLTDARRWFVEYAEIKLRAGAAQAAFEGLEELARLTDDPEVLELLAGHLRTHGETARAVEQLSRAYAQYTRAGRTEQAEAVKAAIREIDPAADPLDVETAASGPAAPPGGGGLPRLDSAPADTAPHSGAPVSHGPLPSAPEPTPTRPPARGAAGMGADDDEVEIGGPLPLLDLDAAPERDDDAADDVGATAADTTDTGAAADTADTAGGAGLIDGGPALVDLDVDAIPRLAGFEGTALVESDDGAEVGTEPPRIPAAEPAPDAPDPGEATDATAPLDLDSLLDLSTPNGAMPVDAEPGAPDDAPADVYVDLGSLLRDDDGEEESAPADDDGDLAELLAQFKAQRTGHLSTEDASSHYDLGLAFKEMGLVDEAIAEFRTALGASEYRLKIYEELGQCFIEKGEYAVAERILGRALQLPHEDEMELLGVYYHLGRCREELGRPAEARDSYRRVAALDAGFRDIASRLARL